MFNLFSEKKVAHKLCNMSRSRAWCFTINNPTDDEKKACDEIECNYIVYGNEVGAEGTPHLQGYLELKDGKTLSAVQKLLGGRAHLEKRKGTPKQASEYCKKDGRFTERGNLTNQGKRNDLKEVAELVKTGGVKAVTDTMPEMFIKHGRNIERLAELLMEPRDKNLPPKVIYLWGKSGTGKTYEACSIEDPKDLYVWTQPRGYWWNGYTQQKRVVIDDFHHDGTEADFRYMLQLLHEYPFQVQTKGGMIHFNSPEIYITSEFPPEYWFTKSENNLYQFTRRLTEVREVKHIVEPEKGGDVIYESDVIDITQYCSKEEPEPEDNVDEIDILYPQEADLEL